MLFMTWTPRCKGFSAGTTCVFYVYNEFFETCRSFCSHRSFISFPQLDFGAHISTDYIYSSLQSNVLINMKKSMQEWRSENACQWDQVNVKSKKLRGLGLKFGGREECNKYFSKVTGVNIWLTKLKGAVCVGGDEVLRMEMMENALKREIVEERGQEERYLGHEMPVEERGEGCGPVEKGHAVM